MLFRTIFDVTPFGITHGTDPIVLDDSETKTRIVLRPFKEDEFKHPQQKDDWIAECTTEESLSKKVEEQFITNRKECTPAMEEFSKKASSRLHTQLLTFLSNCRWRFGVTGHQRIIRCVKTPMKWSVDGVEWHYVPKPLGMVISIESIGSECSAEKIDNIKRMSDYPPVCHELFREAWNLKSESPRSSLLIGIAALEVGLKELISKTVPDSEWLCFHVPAPPVIRMLREFLPKLPVKNQINGKVFVPEEAIKILHQAIDSRNDITHKGKVLEYSENLEKVLSVIRSTLYLFDFYCGHIWALNFISNSAVDDEVRKEWELQEAKAIGQKQTQDPKTLPRL